MRNTIYVIMISCFVMLGLMDVFGKNYRSGVIALLFAIANLLIFWK